jgi:nicotinamidase-related amidase
VLTAMDPIPALVLIDLQKGIVTVPTVHSTADVVDRAAELAAAFHRHGLPVVLVNVSGAAPGRTEAGWSQPAGYRPPPDWSDIVAELDTDPSDYRVTKRRWGAFHETPLDQFLRDRGVTQLVLGGVSTSVGVESTARAAHEHGYHVVLATDVMTDTNADAHRNSVERIFPKLGETATGAEVIEALDASRE